MKLFYTGTLTEVQRGDKVIIAKLKMKAVVIDFDPPAMEPEEERTVTVERDVRHTRTRRIIKARSIGTEWRES